MAKNSIDAYGASGKSNVLFFEPAALHLVTDPSHPLYDERIHLPVDEAMVLNIMDQGVLEPVLVWKDPESGKVCVVDGRQRVRHSMEANTRLNAEGKEPVLVPAIAKRGSAVRMSQYMVSANEIRRADTPLGRAKKMASMLERGHDEQDLGLLFGCSLQTVKVTLSLLDCTQAVQDAVESGQVTVTSLDRAGTVAANGVKRYITITGFTPLSDVTIAQRRKRGRTGNKPLIDTGEYRRSITHVVRDKDADT